MRIHYYKFPEGTSKDIMREHGLNDDEDILGGIPVSEVKKLIKKYGGVGYTMHYERDETLFETTPITLKGDNIDILPTHKCGGFCYTIRWATYAVPFSPSEFYCSLLFKKIFSL